MRSSAVRRSGWVTILLALSGCAAVTTMDPWPPREGQPRPLPVAGTQLFDWKGIVHCHSHLSHDSQGTIEEISAACREARIDFVAMTDHQTDASIHEGVRGFVGDTLFMVGAEVRSPQGTVLAFPLQEPLRHWQHAGLLIKEAADQGALAFICHGELWRKPWDAPGITGCEIVNLHAGAMAPDKTGTLLVALFAPMRWLMMRFCTHDPQVFAGWDRLLSMHHPCAPVGGDDAHANVHVFGPLGGTMGTYREVFSTLSTHVLAERLDEASLVEALRLGRSYVSFDIFAEGAGFDFRAVDAAGVHVVGSEVAASADLRLCVRLPRAADVQVLRDGVVVERQQTDQLELKSPAPGIWRVEAYSQGGHPWLFSSTIRVTGAEAR
jgi:hypothetical protein